ncbi:MAG: HIT family protein [Anaerolineae bacterium]|nr:HIT family protein [Anaerolineae bacterium]
MYNHEPENYICPFCRLIQGIKDSRIQSVQSDIIYHDDAVTVFISSGQRPSNLGNILIAPNEHIENLYDLPEKYGEPMLYASKMIAMALKAVYHCEGVSTRQHNEPSGGQDVWHYHLHVTPRYHNDRFYQPDKKLWIVMPVEERAQHAEKIRQYLAAQAAMRSPAGQKATD